MTAQQLFDFIAAYSVPIVLAMFVLFLLAEALAPLRVNRHSLTSRWFSNISLTVVLLLVYQLLSPVTAVVAALTSEYLGLGLFNGRELALPVVLLSSILILDLKQYLFHWLVHRFDWTWHLHKVHHSDLELDITTGFRFHPGEGLLNALADYLVIVAFGIPLEVIALRYLLIYLTNFFTHANLNIPPALDRALRRVLVTPRMHHLHHSMDRRAANSNYGVFLSTWDHIFGTYLAVHPDTADSGSEPEYVYGLREYREPAQLGLPGLIIMPFRSSAAGQDAAGAAGKGEGAAGG